MSPVSILRAWDGRYYTMAEFLAWYGQDRGLAYWNEAASPDLPVGRAPPRDFSEIITVSFCLVSGHRACRDMVAGRTPGPSTRVLRNHLSRYSVEDEWDSTLLIDDKILDWGCGNVLAFDQAERMLADTPGRLRVSVIRRPLWAHEG